MIPTDLVLFPDRLLCLLAVMATSPHAADALAPRMMRNRRIAQKYKRGHLRRVYSIPWGPIDTLQHHPDRLVAVQCKGALLPDCPKWCSCSGSVTQSRKFSSMFVNWRQSLTLASATFCFSNGIWWCRRNIEDLQEGMVHCVPNLCVPCPGHSHPLCGHQTDPSSHRRHAEHIRDVLADP